MPAAVRRCCPVPPGPAVRRAAASALCAARTGSSTANGCTRVMMEFSLSAYASCCNGCMQAQRALATHDGQVLALALDLLFRWGTGEIVCLESGPSPQQPAARERRARRKEVASQDSVCGGPAVRSDLSNEKALSKRNRKTHRRLFTADRTARPMCAVRRVQLRRATARPIS